MSEYTQSCVVRAESLDIAEEKLLYENAKEFRRFDEAFIDFISEHGYIGDSTDTKAMKKFVIAKFDENGVEKLRNFKDLFNPNKGSSNHSPFEREVAFKISFALGLNIDETNDFFKRVMFERGIDCHSINEAVYYFGINNGLSYMETKAIIDEIPKIEKTEMIPGDDILYTDKIEEYIESISEKENLIRYIKENLESFEYNNATAIKFIRLLWKEIVGKKGAETDEEKGLAFNEGKLIDKMLNPFHPNQEKRPVEDTREMDVVDAEINREKELKQDDYVISDEDASTWTIYCQIMGLDNQQKRIHTKTNRSLAPIFSKNVLLPLKASYCFPNQETIDGLLRGEADGDYEKFRKMLIFLTFYTYCVKKIIKQKDVFVCFDRHDKERCQEHINKYLVDAGYPKLYYGNPYDWIFLWSMQDQYPLDTFRMYMREVYIAKSQMTE